MATTSYGTPYVDSADLVSGYPGTSLSLADRVDDISFKGNGINNQTGTTYTLDILDAGKTVTLSNSSAVTVTIPTNTAEAIEVGSIIRFNNKGAGTVTIQPDGGVTLNGGNISLAQHGAVQIIKLDTNTWGQIDSLGTAPGLALLTPSSIANSGGSASLSGGAVTFTTVNSISLNGVFSGTYQNYRIVYAISAISADNDVRLRWRVSGADATGANYTTAAWLVDNAGTLNFSEANATSFRTNTLYNALNDSGSASIDVYNPGAAVATTATAIATNSTGTANARIVTSGGRHTVATAYDGVTIFPPTGTISGVIRVYGYRS